MGARRVLVVDDEEIVRLSLRDMLEIAGYEVVGEAADGKEAIQKAHALRPDVILMDICMPHLDGVQAAAEIAAANPVPVLFLTAYFDSANVARAGDAGGYAYLVKPCRQADLAPAIEMAVARFADGRRSYRDMERVRWALETVRRLALEIATNPDIEGVVDLALRCVLSALKAPGAALLLLDDDLLRVRAHHGLDADAARSFCVPLGETVFGQAVAEARPVWVAGAEAAELGTWASLPQPFGRCGGALAVPLRAPETGLGEQPYGCLAVLRAETAPFSAAEVTVLSALAGEMVVAFQVAQARHGLAWRRWRKGEPGIGMPVSNASSGVPRSRPTADRR